MPAGAQAPIPQACFAQDVQPEAVEIVAGEPFGAVLLADGRRLRLAEIRLADEVGMAVEGRALIVVTGAQDRWGQLPAHVLAQGPHGAVWLQADLLERGLAVVDPETGGLSCLQPLLAAEDAARHRDVGLWRVAPVLRADQPDLLLARTGHFAVVEGRIHSLGKTRRYRYLNFGRHWASDFTATVDTRVEADLTARGLALDDLNGARVRIRGVVQAQDGPHIELTHPAQLERLPMEQIAQ
ncbi:Nuclease (SNase-like) [Polymorphum gilvum SL003B-26A1]|uniref:Nuclease (SNase-like) n=1 Tax=Polymorphum gilvum (strain LMG 25793 / CGMCC 1.9160 / SL003B-26A1) TaxID=991905 RepID=F2J269_POLGS|nr:Nuclease (SNase-like) [Polymorphum gilvum SL003B-26A1]